MSTISAFNIPQWARGLTRRDETPSKEVGARDAQDTDLPLGRPGEAPVDQVNLTGETLPSAARPEPSAQAEPKAEQSQETAMAGGYKPGPIDLPANPKNWKHQPLALLTLEFEQDNGTEKVVELEAYASRNATAMLKGRPLFTNCGPDEKAAKELASEYANESDKLQRATFFGLAEDNNYYVAHIGTKADNGIRWEGDSCGWDKVKLLEAKPLAQGIKGLVGEKSWVNFDSPK